MTKLETCKHGHEWTPENTLIIKKTGARQCRQCKNNSKKKHSESNKKPTSFHHYRQG
jgi:hypothetical protein